MDGDTLVISDINDGQLGTNAGAVHVWERLETARSQSAELFASDGMFLFRVSAFWLVRGA